MNQTLKLLLITCCVAHLCSCNTAKQLEKKQAAALKTVMDSRPLLDKVCDECFKIYANPDDSAKLIFIKGDSTPYPVPVKDPAAVQQAIDSLQKIYALTEKGSKERTDCNNEIDAAYNKGYADAENKMRSTKVPPVPTVDMEKLKQYIAGMQFLRRQNSNLNDSLNAANKLISVYQSSEKQLGYSAKLFLFALMRQWWFWAWFAALAAWIFRHPLISILSNIKR